MKLLRFLIAFQIFASVLVVFYIFLVYEINLQGVADYRVSSIFEDIWPIYLSYCALIYATCALYIFIRRRRYPGAVHLPIRAEVLFHTFSILMLYCSVSGAVAAYNTFSEIDQNHMFPFLALMWAFGSGLLSSIFWILIAQTFFSGNIEAQKHMCAIAAANTFSNVGEYL